MIHVKSYSPNKNINLYNIIKIFRPDEEVAFSEEFVEEGLFIECLYREEKSLARLYKDGVLVKERIKDNTELKYRKIKATINNLYKLLSEYFGYESDYGTLTGIRPVKLVRKYLDQELEITEIYQKLEDKYLLKKDKINQLIGVAKLENKLIDKNKISLYINIPFCPSKCSYCNFVSYVNREEEIDRYIKFLLLDLKENINLINKYSLEVESIYIGGGTPSILSSKNIKKILKYCTDEVLDFKEFTFEAGRTDTLTAEKIEILENYGVNRISLNPQTFNQKTLNRLNRTQDLKDFYHYFNLCRDKGFIINSDLIIGLPGENYNDMMKTIDKLIELKPDNITVHSLAVKRTSDLNYSDNLITAEELEKVYNYAYSKLRSQGYNPYYLYRQKNILGNLDNIGYSLVEKESLYNINIIEETQTIISAGLGSVSKIIKNNKIHRIPYNKNLNDYYHKYNYVNNKKKEYLK